MSVSFSPCGGRIVSASQACTIKVWEASTGTCQSTLSGHSRYVRSVCFSPDGKQIASGSDDETVKIWNASSGELQSTLIGHGDAVTQLEFRDATTLVSASDDGTTRFWDVESGAEKGQDAQGTRKQIQKSFSKTNSKEQVVGGFIVTAQGDLVRVYEVDEGVADKNEKKTPVAFFAAPSPIASLACAGDKIAVGLENGGVLDLRAAFLAIFRFKK
jgi:WD40 repeat protein